MVVTTINILKQIQGKSMLQQNRRVDKRGGQGDVTFIFQLANRGYLWNPHSDFDETWPIVFLGY